MAVELYGMDSAALCFCPKPGYSRLAGVGNFLLRRKIPTPQKNNIQIYGRQTM